MKNCLQCQKETKNPKFCSRSCSTIFNNKIHPKRKVEATCKICATPIPARKSYCIECNPNIKDWGNITYEEVIGIRKYQKNSRIRNLARVIYKKSDKPKCCSKCGYDKHYEVCHIKAIKSFNLNSKISEINNLDNLIALCPNCHWELDNLKHEGSDSNRHFHPLPQSCLEDRRDTPI